MHLVASMDFSKTVKPKHQYKYGAKGQTFSIRPSPPSHSLPFTVGVADRIQKQRREREERGRREEGKNRERGEVAR